LQQGSLFAQKSFFQRKIDRFDSRLSWRYARFETASHKDNFKGNIGQIAATQMLFSSC